MHHNVTKIQDSLLKSFHNGTSVSFAMFTDVLVSSDAPATKNTTKQTHYK